jgi:hypothetical protein
MPATPYRRSCGSNEVRRWWTSETVHGVLFRGEGTLNGVSRPRPVLWTYLWIPTALQAEIKRMMASGIRAAAGGAPKKNGLRKSNPL